MFWHFRRCNRPQLCPSPVYYVFVDDEAFEADGTAAVQAVGADAHFGAEAIAKSIGKSRGGIVYDRCRIYGLQKSLRGLLVFGYDRVGVVAAVFVDVGRLLLRPNRRL